MVNILVIVSALQDAPATAASLARMHAAEAARIHLLSIESPPSGYARSFLGGIDLRKQREEDAMKAMGPLRIALDALGVPYRCHVEIGPWLDTIARYSIDVASSRIVVGDNPRSAFRGLVLRHDCWRIKSHLRHAGRSQCAVVRGSEEALSAEAAPAREASILH